MCQRLNKIENAFRLAAKLAVHSFGKFLLTGGINSAVSYGLYLALAWVIPYQVAYALSYFAGIILSYVLQCRFVFHVKPTLKTLCAFPLIYMAQYVVSALLLELCIRWLKINVAVAPLLVMAIVAPGTYVLTKYVLTKISRKPSTD